MIPLCISASWQIEVGELWAATLPEQTSAPAVSQHASCRVSLRSIWMCLVTHCNNGDISPLESFSFWKSKEMDSFLLSWTLAWITRTISKVPLVTTSSRKRLQRHRGCGCVGRQWDKTWPWIWLKADQKEQVPKFPLRLNGYQCYQCRAPKAVLFDMN